MKHSQLIGALAIIGLFITCFFPWVYVPSHNITIDGFHKATDYGRPGLMNFILCVPALLFFLINKVWAKITNLFFCTLNFAWCIKNFIVLRGCPAGDCPVEYAGIYLQLFFGLVIFIMCLLPKLNLVKK